MFPDGHLVLKADRMKHHLELEEVESWPPLYLNPLLIFVVIDQREER